MNKAYSDPASRTIEAIVREELETLTHTCDGCGLVNIPLLPFGVDDGGAPFARLCAECIHNSPDLVARERRQARSLFWEAFRFECASVCAHREDHFPDDCDCEICTILHPVGWSS